MLLRNSLCSFVGLCLMVSWVVVQPLNAQGSGTIRGTVLDATTGDGLPGANVFLAGTSMGTATDLDGKYEIGRAHV